MALQIAGKKIPKWALWAGAGGVVLAGLFYFKEKKASAAASSSTNSSAIDPVTGLPYSEDNTVDPLTGLTYLAEAEQYGSVSAAEAAYAGNSSAAIDSGASGSAYGYPTIGTGFGTTTTVYTSNSQWGQSAIAVLESLGYSSSEATTAIAAYLAGMTLTSSQSQLVQLATAEIGPPPTPIAIQTTPSGSNSGGGIQQGPNPPTPIGTGPVYPLTQTGTVHSNTTGGTGQVRTTDGGDIWVYDGVPPSEAEIKANPNQTGTVTSATTGRQAAVKTTDGGLQWDYAGVPSPN